VTREHVCAMVVCIMNMMKRGPQWGAPRAPEGQVACAARVRGLFRLRRSSATLGPCRACEV